MTKTEATKKAMQIVENALEFFKSKKNFGAQTTIKRAETLKAQISWLMVYCDKKSIDIQQFV